VVIYFDNIIVFSKDFKLYNGYIWSVMDKLMKAGIMLKIKKCKFDIIIVKYFRMIYFMEGLQILLEKVDVIVNWFTSTNVTGV
jgi:hypothetical protein